MKKISNILMKGIAGLLFVALLAVNVQVGLVETNGSDTSTELVLTNQAKAQVVGGCKVQVVYCTIWPWSGTAQHCITTGDGVDCNCGDSTTCGGDQQ